jgi:hypothetical protein
MTPRSVLLVVKLHKLETAIAALASLTVGLAALHVSWRLAGLSVPGACLRPLEELTLGTASCLSYLEALGRIYYGEAGHIHAIMAVLPGAVGLLAGVPIVGRELEGGTAEFAWAVAPSRRAWFIRQAIGIGLPLAVCFGFAAVASDVLETTRRPLIPATPFDNLGLYGVLAFTRMLAAFGLGLVLGALTGRTLPAFVIGSVVMAGLVVGAGLSREAWASVQPTVVVDETRGDPFDGEIVGRAWIGPAGEFVTDAGARDRVPADVRGDPDGWLMAHGYEQVALGITRETAERWQPLEGAGWVAAAIAFAGGSLWLVHRRRPV